MEQERECQTLDLHRLENKISPEAHSGYPTMTVKVKEEEEEKSWVPNNLNSEEIETFAHGNLGLPDIKIKVKEEEELWAVDHHVPEENSIPPTAHSGFPNLKPDLSCKTKRGEENLILEQKNMEENGTPDHNSGFPDVMVKMEKWEGAVSPAHDGSGMNQAVGAPCSGVLMSAQPINYVLLSLSVPSNNQGTVQKVEKPQGICRDSQAKDEPAPQPAPRTGTQQSQVHSRVNGTPDSQRIRAKFWSHRELGLFIDLWISPEAQQTLQRNYRNESVYTWISEEMAAQGFTRSPAQCREKINGLKKKFKEVTAHNKQPGVEPRTMPFYDKLATILLNKKNMTTGYAASGGIPAAHQLRVKHHAKQVSLLSQRDFSPSPDSSRRVCASQLPPPQSHQPLGGTGCRALSLSRPSSANTSISASSAAISSVSSAAPPTKLPRMETEQECQPSHSQDLIRAKRDRTARSGSPSLLAVQRTQPASRTSSPTLSSRTSSPTVFQTTQEHLGVRSRALVTSSRSSPTCSPAQEAEQESRSAAWNSFPQTILSEVDLATEAIMEVNSSLLPESSVLERVPTQLSQAKEQERFLTDVDDVIMRSLARTGEPPAEEELLNDSIILPETKKQEGRGMDEAPLIESALAHLFEERSGSALLGFPPGSREQDRSQYAEATERREEEERLKGMDRETSTLKAQCKPLEKTPMERVEPEGSLTNAQRAARLRNRRKTDRVQLARDLVRAIEITGEHTCEVLQELDAKESQRRARDHLLSVWATRHTARSIRDCGELMSTTLRESMRASDQAFERAMAERTAAIERQTHVLDRLAAAMMAALPGQPSQAPFQQFPYGPQPFLGAPSSSTFHHPQAQVPLAGPPDREHQPHHVENPPVVPALSPEPCLRLPGPQQQGEAPVPLQPQAPEMAADPPALAQGPVQPEIHTPENLT
ncbi:uncharacterized protein LOC123017784 [Varanus komodoensis]|uniref:uncharacterized protein LOC123017784 n=1 Tax=Varanus komodoensis TaxID=61221 RepID=UPI001CF7B31C|nr:uncharacterized protein LOC123017784 [Varanus komodoensis]XP_044275291.1 uncharacterized protein LOC123017784 [Varanus komodoensis]XP_044275292.1 uncharacterized protein LOC123017784 [Varanus komodoensis]XP_044275293.1 uncharacterized protein LOC123017784 [Varanus komodoensis]